MLRELATKQGMIELPPLTPEEEQGAYLCKQIRMDCEDLLESYGKPRKSLMNALVALAGEPILSPYKASEFWRYTFLRQTIDLSSLPETLIVEVQHTGVAEAVIASLGNTAPRDARIILVEVQSLPIYLQLLKNSTEVWAKFWGSGTNVNPLDRLVGRPKVKGANLFGEVVNQIKRNLD